MYIDVQTAEIHELLPDGVSGPCFSPDGQSIAFNYNDKIYVAPRNDIEARREIFATPGAGQKHLSWCDDDCIYFEEDKVIYRVSISGKGDKEKVAGLPSQLKNSKVGFRSLSVANDGKRAAWYGKNLDGKLEMVRFPWISPTRMGHSPITARAVAAKISPDGKFVVKNSG